MLTRRPILRTLLLLGSLCLGCVGVALAAWLLQPPRFTTRTAAIGYVLRQHQIVYDRIELEQGWPDQINTSTFGANVYVYLPELGRVGGRFECRTTTDNCWVAVPRLNLDMTPVPDLTITKQHPLLAWIDQQTTSIKRYLP